jgi:putative ATPase
MIETGKLHSLVLWGPPGTGKTTLARIVAASSAAHFSQFSAVTAGVADIRRVIGEAQTRQSESNQQTVLFVDEIHRFSKSQQDAFLPHVETGTIILIGATTENPGFEIIGPLISRSHVYRLEALFDQEIELLLKRGLKMLPNTRFQGQSAKLLARLAGGDARTALNALEFAAELATGGVITPAVIEQAFQRKAAMYDKKGDAHYDTISAFIKSLRGSDPNAALHYLARMLEGGEDAMFIARRMVIFASEDIGNAQPTALVLATSAMQATHLVGLPEAQLILAQTATYLATAPKSRAVTRGLEAANYDVRHERLDPIPMHIRNPVNKVVKQFGAGKGYRWPTKDGDQPTDLGYLPENLKKRQYYDPPKRS